MDRKAEERYDIFNSECSIYIFTALFPITFIGLPLHESRNRHCQRKLRISRRAGQILIQSAGPKTVYFVSQRKANLDLYRIKRKNIHKFIQTKYKLTKNDYGTLRHHWVAIGSSRS